MMVKTVRREKFTRDYTLSLTEEQADALIRLACEDDRPGVGAFVRARFVIPLIARLKTGKSMQEAVSEIVDGID